jgi:hypothetical protein
MSWGLQSTAAVDKEPQGIQHPGPSPAMTQKYFFVAQNYPSDKKYPEVTKPRPGDPPFPSKTMNLGTREDSTASGRINRCQIIKIQKYFASCIFVKFSYFSP